MCAAARRSSTNGSGRQSIEVPTGPALWICGDCHVGNLGPVADVKGRVDVQIRDLDQTVIGNPAHDLIRLGLSLAMAARGSNLPGVTTARMIEQLVARLRGALRQPADASREDNSKIVDRIVQLALRRRWKNLAEGAHRRPAPDHPARIEVLGLEPGRARRAHEPFSNARICGA